MKTSTLGDVVFLLLFRASGFWVEDSRGMNVVEARNTEVARAVADILNAQSIPDNVIKQIDQTWSWP